MTNLIRPLEDERALSDALERMEVSSKVGDRRLPR